MNKAAINITEVRQEILQFIIVDKVDAAIKRLLDICYNLDRDDLYAAVMISGEYHELHNKMLQGIIEFGETRAIKQNIRLRILQLSDKIFDEINRNGL